MAVMKHYKNRVVFFLELSIFRKLGIKVISSSGETCLWLVLFDLFEERWCRLTNSLIFGLTWQRKFSHNKGRNRNRKHQSREFASPKEANEFDTRPRTKPDEKRWVGIKLLSLWLVYHLAKNCPDYTDNYIKRKKIYLYSEAIEYFAGKTMNNALLDSKCAKRYAGKLGWIIYPI